MEVSKKVNSSYSLQRASSEIHITNAYAVLWISFLSASLQASGPKSTKGIEDFHWETKHDLNEQKMYNYPKKSEDWGG